MDDDPEVLAIEAEFASVFRDDLPEELPPKRDIDYEIETHPDSKPPHRPIFQYSFAELEAIKDYVTDFLRKRKIHPTKSPFGALLSFVNQKESSAELSTFAG